MPCWRALVEAAHEVERIVAALPPLPAVRGRWVLLGECWSGGWSGGGGAVDGLIADGVDGVAQPDVTALMRLRPITWADGLGL